MKPFFDLEDNKGRPLVDLKLYDMHLLCSVLMEAIITEMGGLMAGAQYTVILRELSKIVLQINPAASASDIDRIASHIIGHLSNERGRGHFEASYQIVREDGTVETLTHLYRLLEQRLSPDDELVYIATPEAIHIYLSGLGHDLEAEQAANDALIEHYLRRGKHLEAGEAADVARKRSVEQRTRLRGWLVTAERSFDEIQYAAKVLPELDRMVSLVDERGRIEQRQIEEIQTRAIQLPQGDDGRNALIEARKSIEESSTEQVRLLADLQRCSRTLLDWQSHHRFRRGESPALPDPMIEFLEPLLRLKFSEFSALLTWVWPLMIPPTLPVLADLPSLMDSLLADVRQQEDNSELDPIPESCEDLETPKRFTSEVCKSVEDMIRDFDTTFTLSDALVQAEQQFGPESAELAYTSVLIPRWFEHEPADSVVAQRAERQLKTAGYFGDELLISKGNTV
jgi:hypothetical protein